MARKDKVTNTERELMRLTYLEKYLADFIKNYSRPTRRYDKLNEALEEVGRERMLLSHKRQEELLGGAVESES